MPQTLRFSQSSQDETAVGDGVDPAEAAQPDVAKQDEANMRRALGMLGGTRSASTTGRAAGPAGSRLPMAKAVQERRASPQLSTNPRRHRFVQDGDVPVTIMRRPEHAPDAAAAAAGSLASRLEAMQASLVAEHAARERAERASEEAQATIRDLRTKLAHMELAREEAADLARRIEEPVPAPAPAEVAADEDKSPRRTRGLGKRTLLARGLLGETEAGNEHAATRPTRAPREPKPVKWWVRPRTRRSEPKTADLGT